MYCGFWILLFSLRGSLEIGKGKGEGGVVPVLLLADHHAMGACWGVEV
jgi:hypothetical protein